MTKPVDKVAAPAATPAAAKKAAAAKRKVTRGGSNKVAIYVRSMSGKKKVTRVIDTVMYERNKQLLDTVIDDVALHAQGTMVLGRHVDAAVDIRWGGKLNEVFKKIWEDSEAEHQRQIEASKAELNERLADEAMQKLVAERAEQVA